MSIEEENKEVVRRYLELWKNKGKVDSIGEFLTDNEVWHGSGGMEAKWIEDTKQVLIRFRQDYPADIQLIVEDTVVEGDMVMYRFTTPVHIWIEAHFQRVRSLH